MRRRAPGQLGKITLPFRLASNKTRRAIAVFRAASWPGGDLPRRKEAVKGVRVMEQKERETSLRELLGALMATCAGESNELVILAGANLTAISICMDAESSEDAQVMLEDVIGNMRRIVAANLAPPPGAPGATSH